MNKHKVLWQEGMLLRPQHFQHNDRYFENQIKTHTLLLKRNAWGFSKLAVDEQYFNLSKIVVTQASGVLPDGTFFDLAHSKQLLTLDIPPDSGNASVYLALPLLAGGSVESREAGQEDVLARYTRYMEEIADSNADSDSRSQISCGRPDFRLLVGEQATDKAFVKLKLCELAGATAHGGISLNNEFAPTFLNIRHSTYVLACLNEVIALLTLRGEAIAERIQANGKGGAAEVGDFMMLQLINRTELILRNMLDLDQVHPEEVYTVLLGMLGELSTFASDSKRPNLETFYSHEDQAGCLRLLMGEARQLLSMVLEQHAVALPLQERQYGILVAPLQDRSLLGSSIFVLAVSAHCDSEELRKRLPAYLKVAPVESIRQLVNLHLPGIKVKPLPVAPRQIPFHANKTYFLLELHSQVLAQLERSGGFAFHVSGDFDGLDLSFWAIRS
ncbi:type VI secretion system baseplate subunit TssK [Pseudomonas sp. DWP3-1-2]|uniref:type VI secretion system baseplate subunit TssK n=1 Tax=Pseudomonas sp. DWP3-1-2 TaxID=2804645 RepID=UPI003CF536AE